ncbi:hypothetical protein [Rubellimicrobium arenae]|uniref:hypothetical protein n=1 Tax=Rubellimicrobium arenae TaxID=2817372 RepID=UPI001B311B1B|nr:hypothetical protein [Rubellimicrobium arenae]
MNCLEELSASFSSDLFHGPPSMTLFVSMTDIARALHATVSDLRAARRVLRPALHVVRPRGNAAGRGADLLALDGLLVWLNAAMGGGLDPEIATELARSAQPARLFDGVEAQQ